MKKQGVTTDRRERVQIAVLAAQSMSARAISKMIDRSDHAVLAALKCEDVQRMIVETQERFGWRFTQLLDTVLDGITADDIAKAGLRDKIVSAGILTDKARLSLGLSTHNSSVSVHVSVDEPINLEMFRR